MPSNQSALAAGSTHRRSMHTSLGAVDKRAVVERQPRQPSVGGLWRDVLNFMGDGPVSPNLYLPLADAVLPKWAKWTYFLGHAAAKLTKNDERRDVEADVARARVGWRIWVERREELRAYVKKFARERLDDDELEEWWLDGIHHGGGGVLDFRTHDTDSKGRWKPIDEKQVSTFLKLMDLSDEEEKALRYHPGFREQYLDYWLLAWVHKDLRWATQLEMLRDLARKTWPADPRNREHWTPEDVDFVNSFFREQETWLMPQNAEADSFDPFELRIENSEQSLGFGLDGLHYVMYVFLRAVVIDFVDSILDLSRRPTARGSLSCIDCGTFVGRRALGYGQLYCSERCKKRAAKRRSRQRVATSSKVSPAAEAVSRSAQVLAPKGALENGVRGAQQTRAVGVRRSVP